MEEIVARMERIWAQQGPDLASILQTQALLDLGLSVALFLVATHIAATMWALRLSQGHNAPLALRMWTVFLLVPVFLFAVRLTSGDVLLAALGDPLPLLAATATMGMDARPGGAHTPPDAGALTEAVLASAESRAFQILWPMLLMAAVSLWILDRWRRAGMPVHTRTLRAVVPAVVVLLIAAPVAFDGALWSALFGRPDALLEAMLQPAVAFLPEPNAATPSVPSTSPVGIGAPP